MPTVPMMLAPSYVPQWTPFEALREIIANAMDADPAYSIEFPTNHRAVITTSTVPRLAHLLMMGAGTKTSSTGTIGQFGEGAKLSALVLTRTPHCSLLIESDRTSVTFSIDEITGLSEKSLHAHISALSTPIPGCRITIEAPDLFTIYDSNFLPRATALKFGPVGTPDGPSFRVYHRGIKVCDLPERALFHWNVADLTLNRDRSMPDTYHLSRSISSLIFAQPDSTIDALLDNPHVYEWRCLHIGYSNSPFNARLLSRFCAKFGDRCCLQSMSNAGADRAAAALGYRVLSFPDYMRHALTSAGLRYSDEIIADLRPASTDSQRTPTKTQSRLIASALDRLGCPCPVRFFPAESAPLVQGRYDSISTTIWLSDSLLNPGNRSNLLATLFHEAAHHLASGADDLTPAFENALSTLGAMLLTTRR